MFHQLARRQQPSDLRLGRLPELGLHDFSLQFRVIDPWRQVLLDLGMRLWGKFHLGAVGIEHALTSLDQKVRIFRQ